MYSLHYAILDKVDPIKAKPMLKECMLNHAKAIKRRKYENDTLWISWKLLYREGGYAYICFGVEKTAQHKWYVSFNERYVSFYLVISRTLITNWKSLLKEKAMVNFFRWSLGNRESLLPGLRMTILRTWGFLRSWLIKFSLCFDFCNILSRYTKRISYMRSYHKLIKEG